MKKLAITVAICLCLALTTAGSGRCGDRADEVAAFLRGLDSASSVERITTAKLVTKAGITDPVLYDTGV